jgi:hypothetical protein
MSDIVLFWPSSVITNTICLFGYIQGSALSFLSGRARSHATSPSCSCLRYAFGLYGWVYGVFDTTATMALDE